MRKEERRLVTCLFIDVVGSTELTVSLGPERLKAALDGAFSGLRMPSSRKAARLRSTSAIAEAVREELAHDGGGPEPQHKALRAIGYVGLSEILRRRADGT